METLINPDKVILPGVDDHLVDVESMGEKKMSVIIRSEEEQLLVYLRDKLKQGYLLRATDVNKPVLEKDADGRYLTGITFHAPAVKK